MKPSTRDLRNAAAIGNYAWLWECASPIIAGTVQKMRRAGEIGGGVDLEDVCQEASAAVGASLPRWDAGRGAFSTWVTAQTRGAVLDYVNREGNRGTGSRAQRIAVTSLDEGRISAEDALTAAARLTGTSAASDPEALTAADDMPDLSAVDNEFDRALLTRRYGLDGRGALTAAQVAARVGMPLATVKWRLRRALRAVQKALTGT
jgi:RNA polymerase sigma factor (sigma-70 family)